MPNRNKQKGDRFEHAAILTTREYFEAAKRTRAGWDDDRGDIIIVPDYSAIAQVKDCKSKPYYVWLDELDEQIKNAGARHGVLVSKRTGFSDAGEGMAIMRYRNWLSLYADYRNALCAT